MKTRLLLTVCFTFIVAALYCQDRNISFQYNLPTSAFNTASQKIINIKNPPFNAVGDGITDDTPAFIAAYDSLMSAITGVQNSSPEASYVIYIPNGTYRITETIIYSTIYMNDSVADPKPGIDDEVIAPLRFIGQSRENTILQLDNNLPEFNNSTPQPVISFGYSLFNNLEARNSVRNLTINTGTGNADAVAIKMGGANNASIQNVLLQSDDGMGYSGIDFTIGTVVGYYRDITIDGFDYGVRCVPHHFTDPVMEHVSMTNINKVGVLLDKGMGTFRKLDITSSGPAVQLNFDDAHGVFLDCNFNGNAGDTAIIAENGHILCRNTSISGYDYSIYDGLLQSNPQEIIEYINDEVYNNYGNATCGLNLPIEDCPEINWKSNYASDWVTPEDFGAVGDGVTDDSAAIQMAMNSGAPYIFFPNQVYQVSSGINVPSTVERIVGMYAELKGNSNKLIISGSSSDPALVIDDLYTVGNTTIVHSSDRTVVLNNIGTQNQLYENSSGTDKKLFINACNGMKYNGPILNQQAWIRFMNTEAPATPAQFQIDNSTVVCMGFKTEKGISSFEIKNGSSFELLGGVSNQFPLFDPTWVQDTANLNYASFDPIIEVYESEVALTFATTGPTSDQGFNYYVKDSIPGDSFVIYYDSLPERPDRIHNAVLPLYVNHSNNCPVLAIPEMQTTALNIWPNPTTNLVHLNWNNEQSSAKVKVIDLSGKCWVNSTLQNGESIDLNALNGGVYILQIDFEGQKQSQRIVKL